MTKLSEDIAEMTSVLEIIIKGMLLDKVINKEQYDNLIKQVKDGDVTYGHMPDK